MKRLTLLTGRLRRRHYILLVLLLAVALTRSIPGGGAMYTRHIYPIIGGILSPISGCIPFAVGDLFIALSLAWVIIYPCYAILKKGKKKTAIFLHVAEYLLWVYAWFYIAWGLNYSQPNFYSRTGIQPVAVSQVAFKRFAYRYAHDLNQSFGQAFYLHQYGKPIPIEDTETSEENKNTEKAILSEYAKIGSKEGINPSFNPNPHAKTMLFSPLSSMAGVTGSMGPFFCEFTLNGEVLPHEYPAIYAHEYAHFLGISNEGEANLYSYIVCTASRNKYVRFSGYYHILFHVLANVYNILGEKEGDEYIKHIHPQIIKMAKGDRLYWNNKRCTLLDDLQNIAFDIYLKGNNVSEGRKSYSGVIGLILAYETSSDALAQ